jgi:hypothetical protein
LLFNLHCTLNFSFKLIEGIIYILTILVFHVWNSQYILHHDNIKVLIQHVLKLLHRFKPIRQMIEMNYFNFVKTPSLVCFADHCLSYCPFSFGHCVFCPSLYGFWLPLWYIQTLLASRKMMRKLGKAVNGYIYSSVMVYKVYFNSKFTVPN